MICSTCKAPNADSARFCSECGAELHNDGPVVSADAQGEITQQQSREKIDPRILVDTPHDRLLGSTIAAKYRIDAKLGAGGMGTVYRARRLLIGDEVAVKILHSEQSDPRAAERFRREAQAAARLRHPNAVAVYDFGVTDNGLQYLVMELVEGESLRRIIQQQGPVAPLAAAEIMNQVCAALDEAHRHHVLHRDLKPDNIVVSVTDAGVGVKVLDFGIAKLRDDAAGNLTQTGSILGTPHYMSPEQCMGEELDSRSDIYSLGVVLYEMLTGVVPFRSPSSAAVVVQHVTQPPPSLRSINASISLRVEAVVLEALQKGRAARPQTAGEFAKAFSSAVAGNSPGVGTVSTTLELTTQTQPTIVTPKPFPADSFSSSANHPMRGAEKRRWLGYVVVSIAALVLGGMIVTLLRLRDDKPVTSNRQNANSNRNLQLSSGADSDRTSTPLRITATASSVRLPIQTNSYDAPNAIDGKRNTAWVEGATGPGIGEWIRFDFDREITIHRMIVQPGYFKSPQIWNENNRLAAVIAQFSNGSSRELSLTDRMENQSIDIGGVRTSWVRLVVKAIYHGSDSGRYDDTTLSEVVFEWEP